FGMMVLVGAALMIDLRLLGFGRSIPLGSMQRLFGVMWGAFWLNLVTGTMLFIADATKRATQPLFIVKLVLVALGIVTIVMIKRRLFDGRAEPVVISGPAKRSHQEGQLRGHFPDRAPDAARVCQRPGGRRGAQGAARRGGCGDRGAQRRGARLLHHDGDYGVLRVARAVAHAANRTADQW